jgi:ABC-2 type transport system permease protein
MNAPLNSPRRLPINPRLLRAIALKEFRHILRDGQTLFIILSLPVVMMFLFGYALKSEIEDARIVLIDPHPTASSRQLAAALEANRLFTVVAVVPDGNPTELLITQRARAVLRIESDFARTLQEMPVTFGAWFDASDPATATTLRNALPGFLRGHVATQAKLELPQLVQVDARFLFNPEQESALFFVPGLMASILAMISALLTSVTVTKEKERGTLANLRISMLRSPEIIAGKLLPYFVIAAVTGVLILAIGRVAFGVQVQGSLAFLAAATSVYLIANLAIGLLISTVVAKQQHAMLLSLGITMMPTIMLSGFIFPLASLPLPLQALSKVIPATWYLQIVRGVILKGAGLAELYLPVLVLAGMGALLLTMASVRFAKEK